MRPSELGLERETAKNYPNSLARYKNVSRIKSVIVGPSMGKGKHMCKYKHKMSVSYKLLLTYKRNGYMPSQSSLCMKHGVFIAATLF